MLSGWKYIAEYHPGYDWYVAGDDDTFFYTDAMRALLSTCAADPGSTDES